MTQSHLSHLECPACGTTYDADVPQNLCACGSPLLARYDLDAVRPGRHADEIAARPPTLWRYRELLPVRDAEHVVTLGEGMTPLLPTAAATARALGVPGLLMKDEGLIPTGSFKARGAAVGVSRAARAGRPARRDADERQRRRGLGGLRRAGRACGRWSRCRSTRPTITRRECVAAGAELYLVDGLIGDAGALIVRGRRRRRRATGSTSRR